jgi:hypothetical protein
MNFKFKSKKMQSFNYSFLVSLPLEWVLNQRLSKHDLISFEMNEEGDLILRKDGTIKEIR